MKLDIKVDADDPFKVAEPQIVPFLYDIIEISSGSTFNLCLDKFGKVWCFKDLDSQQLQAFPEKGANNIKESLQHFSIVFSDQGALFISDKGADSFTYRIKKQAKNGVLIEMLPLDNTPLFLIKLLCLE